MGVVIGEGAQAVEFFLAGGSWPAVSQSESSIWVPSTKISDALVSISSWSNRSAQVVTMNIILEDCRLVYRWEVPAQS
jgi:hypothetical protein